MLLLRYLIGVGNVYCRLVLTRMNLLTIKFQDLANIVTHSKTKMEQAVLLEGIVLESVLGGGYVDFETCCNLRLVCSHFNLAVVKHFGSLRAFDLGEKSTKLKDDAYPRLFHTVTEHCRNLRRLKNLLAGGEMLKRIRFERLAQLPRLTHVKFRGGFFANAFPVSVLKQLPNLRSVATDRLEEENFWELFGNADKDVLPEEAKLRVPELILGQPEAFWRLISLDGLRKLTFSASHYYFSVDFEKFAAELLRCPNLETLHFESCERLSEFDQLCHTARSLPRLKKFTASLDHLFDNWQSVLSALPRGTEYLAKLVLWDLKPSGTLIRLIWSYSFHKQTYCISEVPSLFTTFPALESVSVCLRDGQYRNTLNLEIIR